mgnify:CR=1 FL=1
MNLIETILLSVSLAIDCFTVSVTQRNYSATAFNGAHFYEWLFSSDSFRH